MVVVCLFVVCLIVFDVIVMLNLNVFIVMMCMIGVLMMWVDVYEKVVNEVINYCM